MEHVRPEAKTVHMTESVQAQAQNTTEWLDTGSTSLENTAQLQAAKPVVPKAGAEEVIKNIVGHGLMAIGVGVGASMFAVTIPLGLLGAGVGFVVGKGVEKFAKNASGEEGVNGALIGMSVGTLLTGALVLGGAKLIKDAYGMKQDRKQAAPVSPEAKTTNGAKAAAINLMEDYKSGDFQRGESAEKQIKSLSQEGRRTLLDLFNGKFIADDKLSRLERELTQEPKEKTGLFSNVSHSIQNQMGSRISSMDTIEQLHAAMNAPALATLDATYDTDGKGILDIAYSNAATGSLYVIDGTGHNNPIMAKALKNVFDPFTANYERAIQEKSFVSVEECQAFVTDQLKELRASLKSSTDPVYAEDDSRLADGLVPNNLSWDQFSPIGSLAQLVNIDGKQHLVHIKNGDMMLAIKKNNGDIVFGDVKLGRNSTLGSGPLKAEIIEVEPGDQIMLMTDGIGEYLPKEQLEDAIRNNTHPHLLKDELKNAVMSYGLNNSKNEENAGALAANGSDLHYHDPLDEKNYDDVGFAWLQVT